MVMQKIKISPNSKQRSAIEHPPSPLMILAGAGTGKTFTLENRIVYLIKEYWEYWVWWRYWVVIGGRM